MFGAGPCLDWIAKHSYRKGIHAHEYQLWKMIDLAPERIDKKENMTDGAKENMTKRRNGDTAGALRDLAPERT